MSESVLKTFIASACLIALPGIADFVDTQQVYQKLDANPEVVINSQGLAQHDLSIRGADYSASGVSLNGLRIRSPWSSHYNTDVPMIGNLFSAPTVETGLNNASGNLVGTANFNTQPLNKGSHYSAGIGTKKHYAATLYASGENVGGYFDWEKAQRIDYNANDLERFTGGALLQFLHEEWQFDFLAASQSKEFGAQGYYGAPSTTYAEQQLDDTVIFAGATRGDLSDAYFQASAVYRDLRDQYAVHSSLFYSDITSRNTGLSVEGRTMEIQNIALKLRGGLEYEQVSGDVTKDDRTRGNILIMPEARFERFTIFAGLNSVFQTSESADFLPRVGIDWFVTDNGRIYASYTETEQQPDYQMLYSTAPFQIGNPLLEQQQSKNAELGFKQFLSASCDWRIGTFFRNLENANDWIAYTATDLGDLNIAGIDAAIAYYPSENLRLQAYYQWVHKDNSIENGLYETDYPEQLLNLSAYWKFLNEYAIEFAQTTRLQTENTLRTSSDFGALASLGLHYFPRYAENVRLSLLVNNLWSTDFQSIPGLEPRPTGIFASIAIGW
ncbi:TonB-dependent receptor [Pontiellaceae bacterium B1224]|nr:TonB-dependent receptor [Pontiellaceae bacterium B1224]